MKRLPTNGDGRTVPYTAQGVGKMRTMEDLELVRAVQSGDTDAYGDLFERYQSRIYNFTYGILGNADDARDVTQDAFVRVFEALPRKEQVEFSAYLYRAARNAAYDVTISRGRFDGRAEDMDFIPESNMYADPERTTLFAEQQSTVRDAMAALSEDHRAILMLREVQELSYQEIADALDMTRTNVGVTIMRARLKFKGAFRMSHVDVDSLCAECQDMLPKLSAYIDDELKPEERAKVEAHLDDCPLCRYALDEMHEASKSYRIFVPLIPPEAMKAEVLWRLSNQGACVETPTGDGVGSAHPRPDVPGGETGADERGGGGDGASVPKAGLSAGAKVGIGLGVLAALAIALILVALARMPAGEAAPVLTWGLWRGQVHAPVVIQPPQPQWEPVEEPAGAEGSVERQATGGTSGSTNAPSTPDPPGILLFVVPPHLYVATPTPPPTLY